MRPARQNGRRGSGAVHRPPSTWFEAGRTRRYFDVVAERLRDDIRVIAEGQSHLAQRMDTFRHELKTDIANLDVRVGRLDVRVARLEVTVQASCHRRKKPRW